MAQGKKTLDEAIKDLRFLLDRGYKKEYALRFVSDHHMLSKHERNIVYRMTHSQSHIDVMGSKLKGADYLAGRHLAIDGFNVLITIEAAQKGQNCFLCQDGMLRDDCMAFSNYKIGEGTYEAAEMVLDFLSIIKPKTVRWVFDSQISGSGRLAQMILAKMKARKMDGEALTSPNADRHLSHLNLITATSDAPLICQITHVTDLPALVLSQKKG